MDEARIETERFDLVPLNVWQAFRLTYPWTRDTEFITSFSGSGAPRSRWRWFREMVRPKKRKRFVHAIVPRGQTVAIGIHIMSLSGYRSCRFGIGIHDRSWRRKGVAREVRTRMIDHLFENSGVERLYAEVAASNLPSVFNCQKLGFANVGTLHRAQCDPATGQVHDMLIFEMFREEWVRRKAERNG
ncbi:MAG: GNAT family N-acetyltransferase [Mesorhizobium sp.]|nr:GNAT family protein [Mesorhizobium sp.]MBL8578056.1 GNAT family N-acetyltransferase [Mesorhizobium sp.]